MVLLLDDTSNYLINRLTLLQKKAIRLVNYSLYLAHCNLIAYK